MLEDRGDQYLNSDEVAIDRPAGASCFSAQEASRSLKSRFQSFCFAAFLKLESLRAKH